MYGPFPLDVQRLLVLSMAGSFLKESKRDSKGDMPGESLYRGLSMTSSPTAKDNHNTGRGMFAAEATLLRSQRLGLGRGGSDLQHATAPQGSSGGGGYTFYHSSQEKSRGAPRLQVQRLDIGAPWGLWVGLVASPGSLSRHLSCSSLSPVFDLVDWGRSKSFCQSWGVNRWGSFVFGRGGLLNLCCEALAGHPQIQAWPLCLPNTASSILA